MARIFDLIQYVDETGTEMVHRIPERGSGDFRIGSQVIVRESQAAVFFRDGRSLDVFGPGMHTITTANIPLLVNHFVKLFKKKTRKPIIRVSPETLSVLRNYHFSGNVRELENAIEHAFVMCHDQEIQVEHLPTHMHAQKSKSTGQAPVEKSEKEILLSVLQRHRGNKSLSAQELGMHRSTLWRKLKMHGIDSP